MSAVHIAAVSGAVLGAALVPALMRWWLIHLTGHLATAYDEHSDPLAVDIAFCDAVNTVGESKRGGLMSRSGIEALLEAVEHNTEAAVDQVVVLDRFGRRRLDGDDAAVHRNAVEPPWKNEKRDAS